MTKKRKKRVMGKGRVNAFSFSISIALERRIVSPIFAESFWKKRRDTQSLKISQKYLIWIFLLLFQKFRYLCFEYQKKVLLGKLRKWDFFELSSNTVTERHTQYVTKLFSQYLLNNQLYMDRNPSRSILASIWIQSVWEFLQNVSFYHLHESERSEIGL